MSVLIDKNSKVVCQGITGNQGSFHTEQCIEYGTRVVAGVTPGRGGEVHLGVPVYNTMREAVDESGAEVSMIYVPARFAAGAPSERLAHGEALEGLAWVASEAPIRDGLRSLLGARADLERNLDAQGLVDTALLAVAHVDHGSAIARAP